MPILKRIKTSYPGVYFIDGISNITEKQERIYYIRYRKSGKMIEEKAGRQNQDDMTPARAARIRAQRIEGKLLSNKEKRTAEREQKQIELGKWTIDKLFKEYKAQKVNYKSLIHDENRYQNYLKAQFADKEPRELIQLDLDRLRVHLLKNKKPQTVKHILALLRRIINFGVSKNLCTGTAFKIEMPRVNNTKTEDLTSDQINRLLDVIRQEKDIQAANLMKMALFTGMRRGELFKLKWSNIDYERGFICIEDPKGGLDQKIPINSSVIALLKSHPKSKSPYVFPGRNGKQRTDINHQVNRIKDKAGLPKDFRPLHGLRHVYASMLASSGQVDLYTLQKLLTHKSPVMTQRYAHLRDETLKKASNLAGELITQVIKSKKKKSKKNKNLLNT